MPDKKRIDYAAFLIAHHNNISEEAAFQCLEESITDEEQCVACLLCGNEAKGKNIAEHIIEKHPVKIKWNSISVIQKQKAEKRRKRKEVDEALGPRKKPKVYQGWLPGLGKKE